MDGGGGGGGRGGSGGGVRGGGSGGRRTESQNVAAWTVGLRCWLTHPRGLATDDDSSTSAAAAAGTGQSTDMEPLGSSLCVSPFL